MPADTTYLELSEETGSAHKFYEVSVAGTDVTVRYGRIGERGQVKQSSFSSTDKAKSEASKKIGEKIRKGYAPAVPGGRPKRAVSRRPIVSTRSTATRAPVLWRYQSGSPAFGIFIDDDMCMVGNESGLITTLSHDAEVMQQFRLPEGVKCRTRTGAVLFGWQERATLYAGTATRQVVELRST